MSLPELDPVLHFPKRLMIMGVLEVASVVEASFLRDNLHLSDSDLSKQMKALREAGYVSAYKSGHGRSGITEYRATRAGRQAYTHYKKELSRLIALSNEIGQLPSKK